MRNSLLWVFCVLGGIAACGEVKGTQTDASTSGSDGSTLDTPTACPLGTTAMCSGDDLVTCDGQGNITDTTTCALGCNSDEDRCMKVDPSNGLAAALDDAESAPDVALMGETTIDTDAGSITDQSGARVLPTETINTGPVPIFVIKVKSLTTGGNVTVKGTKALAIVSAGDVSIGHVISVSANHALPGPGAVSNDAACRGGNAAPGNSEGKAGGGGGGFGAPGGAGGKGGNPQVTPGAAGGISGTPELVPLRGGCPGGRASGAPSNFSPGAGGGALQIVSNTAIKLTEGGKLAANGGGSLGPPGPIFCIVNTPCGNGEGGGSGGAILLEAPSIELPANTGLYANGGGGSCSVYGSSSNGTLTTTPAPGQTCSGQTGSGGNGGAGDTNALNGASRSGNDAVGGGGGGGRGRIRVNLPVGVTFSPTGDVSGVLSAGALATR